MTRGEENPRATLTDDEVELMRALRDGEEQIPKRERYWTGPRLAEKFDVSVRQVWNILGYHQRRQGADDAQ